MKLNVTKVSLEHILPLRQQYLKEVNCQIRYHACHERNWSDSFLISSDQEDIGYGSVKGRDDLHKRDAIFEFYVLPQWRSQVVQIYAYLVKEVEVPYVECQTNDFLHTPLVLEFAKKINADTILFAEGQETKWESKEGIVRLREEQDPVFEKNKDAGAYVMEVGGEVVASGGFLQHYNPPFADLYMETRHDCRRLGHGTFMVQELKKLTREAGRVPAARCRLNNHASRATLCKAGMSIAGYMLHGHLGG